MHLDSKGFFSRPLILALCGAALLLLAACAPRVYVEQDDSAGLQGYHRFAWVTPPAGPVRDPILDSQILESRVHNAVSADLKARGFEEVAADGDPDFMVTYHTSSKQKLESTGASFSFGIVDAFPHGFGSVAFPVGNDVQTRDEGTLMLDVIDGKSKRLAWRGWTTGLLNQDNYSDKSVAEAVKNILDKFPAQ
ncbi:MAG TPA: DUF4136 domain-containing protein [Gammaproteobacteria bacterium]|jgi:hypothetical protein|nr:DUF4136 domain-containing protein [Gammaproteobacteria bacterium]